MLERLNQLIAKAGLKQWSFALRRDHEFLDWIDAQTTDMPSDTSFPIRVFSAVHNERPLCPQGRQRTLKSIVDGWRFCGKTGQCACARESVSANVSKTKSLDTEEERLATQQKREQTNLGRYGHVNTGQTETAKTAHAAFYSNQDNIKAQLRKQVATMQQRYGVTNPAHLRAVGEQKQMTMRVRHGVSNPMQSKSIAVRSIATRLANGYAESYYRRNYDRMKTRLMEDCKLILLTSFENYTGVAGAPLVSLSCPTCARNIEWRIDYGHQPRCAACKPRPINYKSKEEIEVYNYICSDLGIARVISGDRRLIGPYEIDILSEEHKLAIEYCGLYWHSESQRINRNYHLKKHNAVEKQGYRLLTLFSDEWLDHSEIVKSKIGHLFGCTPDRRFARSLQVAEINNKEAACFYTIAHIQGPVDATKHLALTDRGKIVCAMSFINARESRGLMSGASELVRYASLPFITVVGGASRLFAHFIKDHSPIAVISYADRRWSDGGLYRKLGFTLEHTTAPDYSYVENHRYRHFRFGFRKDVLKSVLGDFDDTEWEVMRALDYDRIWDCGKYRFVWS